MESIKSDAVDNVASDVSAALRVVSTTSLVSMSATFLSMERNRTSSASWVRPRWDREPRTVKDCVRWQMDGQRHRRYTHVAPQSLK